MVKTLSLSVENIHPTDTHIFFNLKLINGRGSMNASLGNPALGDLQDPFHIQIFFSDFIL